MLFFCVGSLGNLQCYDPGGRTKVGHRVSMAVRSFIFGQVRCPWGSLARMASVGCMWYAKAVAGGGGVFDG